MKSRMVLGRCCCDTTPETVPCVNCENGTAYAAYAVRAVSVVGWADATYILPYLSSDPTLQVCIFRYVDAGKIMELWTGKLSGKLTWTFNSRVDAPFFNVQYYHDGTVSGIDTCLWSGELTQHSKSPPAATGDVYVSEA